MTRRGPIMRRLIAIREAWRKYHETVSYFKRTYPVRFFRCPLCKGFWPGWCTCSRCHRTGRRFWRFVLRRGGQG